MLLSGCSVESEGETSGDESGGEEEVSTATFNVIVASGTGGDGVYTISRDGDGTTDCTADDGEDVTCIVDVHELDLWHQGYKLSVGMPESMCSYRGFIPYFFNVAPIGMAPTAVRYETDEDDNIIEPSTVPEAGNFDFPNGVSDIYYYLPGPAQWVSHAQIFGTPAASADQVKCLFSYKTSDGSTKNCCQGDYDTIATDSEGTTTSVEADWGGTYGTCFAGPGIDDTDHPKTSSGLPSYLITNVPTSGLTGEFVVNKHELSTNLYGANYFLASDHDNITNGLDTGSGIVDGGDDAPQACQVYRWFNGNSTAMIHRACYYQYDCLDTNFEVISRIRVMVREWDIRQQLLYLLDGDDSTNYSWDATPGQTDDDYTGGLDPSGSSPVPDPGPANDFFDWKNIDAGESTSTFDWNDIFAPGLQATIGGDITDLIPYPVDHYFGFIVPKSGD